MYIVHWNVHQDVMVKWEKYSNQEANFESLWIRVHLGQLHYSHHFEAEGLQRQTNMA